MNEYETLLQKHLNAAQTEPGPNLRHRILESAAAETPVPSPVRVNKGMKVFLPWHWQPPPLPTVMQFAGLCSVIPVSNKSRTWVAAEKTVSYRASM